MAWETALTLIILLSAYIITRLIQGLDEKHFPIKILYHGLVIFLIYDAFALAIHIIAEQSVPTSGTAMTNIFGTLLSVLGWIIYLLFGYILILAIKGVWEVFFKKKVED